MSLAFSEPSARKLPLLRLREVALVLRSRHMEAGKGRQGPVQPPADTRTAPGRGVGRDQGRMALVVPESPSLDFYGSLGAQHTPSS